MNLQERIDSLSKVHPNEIGCRAGELVELLKTIVTLSEQKGKLNAELDIFRRGFCVVGMYETPEQTVERWHLETFFHGVSWAIIAQELQKKVKALEAQIAEMERTWGDA